MAVARSIIVFSAVLLPMELLFLRLAVRRAFSLAGTVAQWVRQRRDSQSDGDDFRRKVLELVELRRVRLTRLASAGLWTASAVLGAVIYICILTAGSKPSEMIWLPVAIFVVFTFVNYLPSRLADSKWLSLSLHTFLMALACFGTVFDSENHKAHQMATVGRHLISGIAALICLRFKVLLLSNAVLLGLTLRYDVFEYEHAEVVEFMLIVEVAVMLFKLAGFYTLAYYMKRSSRQEVEEWAGQRLQSAVTSLLELSCDVVLDLDHECSLKEPFPKLAAMLVQGCDRSLRGERLSTFVPERSREKFERSMHGAAPHDEGATAPSVFSTAFRDSMGNVFVVTIYHVPYTTITGAVHHLVGIRESAEEDADKMQPQVFFPRRKRPRRKSAARSEGTAYRSNDSVCSDLSCESDVREGGDGRVSQPCSMTTDSVGGGSGHREVAHPFAMVEEHSVRGSVDQSDAINTESAGKECEVPGQEASKAKQVVVSLEDGLPVIHAPQIVLDDFGLKAGSLHNFDDLLPDGGLRLHAFLQALVTGRDRGTEGCDSWQYFGETELLVGSAFAARCSRRKVWVKLCKLPQRSVAKQRVIIGLGLSSSARQADGQRGFTGVVP